MPSRETLVLLPGLFSPYEELWATQCAALRTSVNLLPLDLVGESVADFAAQVLAAAPARFNLAGLSLGGQVAFEIMRQAPKRVSRLALIGVSARPSSPENIKLRQKWEQMLQEGRYADVVDVLLPLAAYTGPGSNPSLPQRLKSWAMGLGEKAFSSRNRAMMTRGDARPLLASIACPTLVIAGRQDVPVTLAEVQEVAAGIRDAKLIVLDRCGHLAPIEQPAAVTEALQNWLAA